MIYNQYDFIRSLLTRNEYLQTEEEIKTAYYAMAGALNWSNSIDREAREIIARYRKSDTLTRLNHSR